MKISRKFSAQTLALTSTLLFAWANASEAGTWTALKNSAPDYAGTMLQLTDGSIMVQGYSPGSNWNRLKPNSAGSYINGTWSTLAAMSTPRLYFASHILRDGNVWVLGGEYSGTSGKATWTNTGEKYNVTTNTWSPIASHPESQFGDDPTMLLDGDKILVGSLGTRNTYLYDIKTNTWGTAISKFAAYNDRSDEESWVKLSGGKVLTYDIFKSISAGTGYAELYDPATSVWSSISPSDGHALGQLPLLSSNKVGAEQGAALRLCDGRAFVIGGGAGSPLVAHTALYTPATNTWAAGPDIPGNYLADDAPATVMPNCHVLLVAEAGFFKAPSALFDFDPTTNTVTKLALPTALSNELNSTNAYVTRLLMLPTGQVLLATSSTRLWVYTPDSVAQPTLRPVIKKVVYKGAGVFRLTGKRITGQSAGGSYGDDVESDQNFPIIQLKNGATVYYARTSNWSTTDVGTGDALVTTDFCLPTGTPSGSYSMVLSAAGLKSAPATVTIPTTAATCQ
ncbi:MAG: kelch repeat-containing protein [Methylovulum sp.]|nr:kelch repeat-containing protein [Methylovulum sp.]